MSTGRQVDAHQGDDQVDGDGEAEQTGEDEATAAETTTDQKIRRHEHGVRERARGVAELRAVTASAH